MPRRGTSGERHLALFLLGLVLLSPPLLSIFNGPGWLFGIPLLYIYLFAVWGVLIGLTALASERWRRIPGHRPQAGNPHLELGTRGDRAPLVRYVSGDRLCPRRGGTGHPAPGPR